MKYQPLPSHFYKKNRKTLNSRLLPDSLVLIASNELVPWKGDQHYPFVQHPNFFYLTGLEEANAILALCPSHPLADFREVLFVQPRNEHEARWLGVKPSFEKLTEWSGIEHIDTMEKFPQFLKEVSSRVRHVYVDVDTFQPDSHCSQPNVKLFHQVKSLLPFHRFENIKPIISELRLVKSDEEIKQIKHAIQITEQAVLDAIPFIHEGKYEYEIEAALMHSMFRQGADGYSFHPIVASGKNATILHYFQNESQLQQDELLLLDVGASYGNYAADLTRTFPISGQFTEKQLQFYQVVVDTIEFAMPLFVPGNTIEKINQEVLSFMEEPLLKLGLIKKEELNYNPSPVRNYFMHGISHFVGLEVHDVGEKNIPFQPGMILTCEPGLYIDHENTGIRIENMLLITHDKPVILTSTLPIHPDEIIHLMKKHS
jgi:Xaa-Pro aminopeptidase